LEPHLVATGVLAKDHELNIQEIAKVIPCLRGRAKTLIEMAEKSAFFFKKQVEFDEKARSKFLTDEVKPLLGKLIAGLSALDDFSNDKIESLFKKTVEEESLKLGKLAQPVRVALTGTTVSPGIYDVILLLGKEQTLKRLRDVI
jgi:glutamyl-tRNA synthetase